MTVHDILALIWRMSIISSVAICAVLALRLVARRLLGAQAAYLLWLLVPCALLAALLPAPEHPLAAAVRIAPAMFAVTPTIDLGAAAAAPKFDAQPWLLAVWIAGALSLLIALILQQSRYMRSLGGLVAAGEGAMRAQRQIGSPALVGALRPRIVLPHDFDTRFDAHERELVLAHERAHLVRGDAQVNALIALLRCLNWFNPLFHFAASRLRFDQELACDALVISRFPEARRPYADAMLKAQLVGEARQELRLPIGCYWPSTHPLKERIAMLKVPLLNRRGRVLARTAVVVLALGAGYASWAAQPGSDPLPAPAASEVAASPQRIGGRFVLSVDGARVLDTLDMDAKAKRKPGDWQITMDSDEVYVAGTREQQSFVPLVKPNGRFAVSATRGDERWEIGGSAHSIGAGSIEFMALVRHNDEVVSEPHLLLREGEPAAVQIGAELAQGATKGVRLDLTLRSIDAPGSTPAPHAAPANDLARLGIHEPGTPAPPVADAPPNENLAFRKMYPPVYPPDAVKLRIGAKVMLKVLVGVDGSPKTAEIAKLELVGTPKPGADGKPADVSAAKAEFARVSIAATMSWKFEPGMKDGKPQEGYVLVPIDFSLHDDSKSDLSLRNESHSSAANTQNQLQAPSYRRMRPPVYPPEALSQQVSGTVWLRARVGVDGRIDNLDLEDAQPAAARTLGAAAIAAVKDWTFNPAMQDSRAIAADVIVPVEFAIDGQAAIVGDTPVVAPDTTQLARIKVVGKLE